MAEDASAGRPAVYKKRADRPAIFDDGKRRRRRRSGRAAIDVSPGICAAKTNRPMTQTQLSSERSRARWQLSYNRITPSLFVPQDFHRFPVTDIYGNAWTSSGDREQKVLCRYETFLSFRNFQTVIFDLNTGGFYRFCLLQIESYCLFVIREFVSQEHRNR